MYFRKKKKKKKERKKERNTAKERRELKSSKIKDRVTFFEGNKTINNK